MTILSMYCKSQVNCFCAEETPFALGDHPWPVMHAPFRSETVQAMAHGGAGALMLGHASKVKLNPSSTR